MSTNSAVVLTTMKAEVDATPALQTALAAQGASMTLESVTATVAAPSTTVVNADGSATPSPTDLPVDDLDLNSRGSGAVVGVVLLFGAVL